MCPQFVTFGALLLLLVLMEVKGHHEGFCFGVPTGRDLLRLPQKGGPDKVFSMGDTFHTLGFDTWYDEPTAYRWAGMGYKKGKTKGATKRDPVYTTDIKWKVEVYAIEHNKNQMMGWVHLKISVSSSNGKPYIGDRFAITARGLTKIGVGGDGNSGEDAWVAGIGEFVHDFPKCENVDARYVAEEYLPCGGVPATEPFIGGGFIYVRSHNEKLGPTGSRDKWDVYWRFTNTHCNFYSKINFRVQGVVVPKDEPDPPPAPPKTTPSDLFAWITMSDQLTLDDSKIFGSPDPVPRAKTVDCGKKLSAGDMKGVIKSVETSGVEVNPSMCFEDFACIVKKSAWPLGFRLTGKSPKEPGVPMFSGRCGSKKAPPKHSDSRTDGSHSNMQQMCSKDYAPAPPPGQGITEYNAEIKLIKVRKDNVCLNVVHCPTVPPRPRTTPEPGKTTARPSTPKPKDPEEWLVKRGVSAAVKPMTELWDTRIVHGMVMCVLTMFLLPVNSFLARYFKETWMNNRIIYHRVWYFFHHNATAMCILVFLAGMVRKSNRTHFIGTSLTPVGEAHRNFGWFAVVILVVLVVFGGCRPMERKLRSIAIAMHWLMGTGLYVFCLVCVGLSMHIPGCPTDYSKNDHNTNDTFHAIPVIFGLWIAFDIVMHAVMTITECKMDTTLGLTRARFYFPSPMPVLTEHFRYDLPGTKRRVIMLLVYIVVSGLLTLILVGFIGTSDPEGHFFGPMSCTHRSDREYHGHLGKTNQDHAC